MPRISRGLLPEPRMKNPGVSVPPAGTKARVETLTSRLERTVSVATADVVLPAEFETRTEYPPASDARTGSSA